MNNEWRNRIAALIENSSHLTMKGLSLKAGLSETYVRDVLKRGRDPSIESFRKLASVLGVSPIALLHGSDEFPVTIPVVGIVSAGEGWIPVDPHSGHDPIEMDIAGPDMIGFEVRGSSMSPVYRDGELLICQKHSAAHSDNLIGQDCAVLTSDGSGYLKFLKRGTRPGTFTLKSYDPTVDDIEDVSLHWVAPVRWVRRRT